MLDKFRAIFGVNNNSYISNTVYHAVPPPYAVAPHRIIIIS